MDLDQSSLLERSRFLGTDDIGALVDSSHWVIDLPGNFKDYTNKSGNYDKAKMLEVRSGADANGLLLVYVIDKEANQKIVKLEGIFFKKMKSPHI